MQLSKNSINDNSIMNKRILIVHSGFSSWVHFNIYEINAFFMKRYGNYKIDALICNKAVTACDFQTTGNVEIYHRHDWQKKCETCIQHTKKRLTSFCSELIYQDLYIDDTDIKMVDSFLNALPEKITQDYYANLNFKGIEIGKRAYESFQYFLKLGGSIGDIDLIPGTVAYEFLSSSILHVISAKKILKNYDIIMINDIGQTSWGLWADVAFAYNKKVLLCDVNWLLNNPPLHYREITSRLYDDAYEARLRHPLFPGIHKVNYIFSKLSENQEYINKGKSILSNRFSEKRINEFDIHNKYCIPPNKKIVVIFTHLCWDNSLTFGHSFFNSYKKWLLTTYNEIIKNENIFWLFKLHPYELGNHKHVHPQYNTLNYLKKIVEEKPSDNVKLVDTPDINTSDLIPLMHTGITLAGTVSYELPSYGINCITLSAGLHSNLGFTIDVKNEDEYIQLLKNIENLTELDDRTKKMALAYTGLLHSNYISINVEELYGEEGYETKKLSSEKIEKYVDEYFDEFSEMIHRKNYNPLIQNKNSLDTIVPIQSTNAHRKVKIDSTLNLLVDIYRYASNKNSTHSISFRNSLKKGLYSIQNFSCPICNNEYEWHPIAYSVEGFKWNICKHCGLFQLNCRLPKNNMNDFYESGEYTDICTGGLINETRFMLDYKVTARLITALLKRLKYDFSQMNILDIGCGAGSTVLAMKELGATVKGYDLDSQKIQFGQSIIKEIEIGDALAYDKDLLQHSFIVLSDVLEHLFDPAEFLSKLHKKVKLNTQIFIKVPSLENTHLYFHNSSNNHLLESLHIAHLWYFTSISLERLINQCGFKIDYIENIHLSLVIICSKKEDSLPNNNNSYALSLSSINQANNKISIQSFINGIDKIKSDILTKYKFINKDKNFECMQNNHLISFNKIYLLINKKDLSKNIIDDIAKRLVYFVPNIPTNRIDVINQLPLNAYTERNPILFFGSPEYIPNAVPKNRLFNIDYRHNPTDGWDWCRLANYSLNHNVDTESSKMRFIQFIETIKKETLGKTYIFGTGPSLDKAIYRDWSDGYRIVCNTIVRDPILWNHINPHFIVAGDAIYHFGQTVFAKQFRQDLAKRLDETETYFFYPDLFDVIVQRELSQFSDKLIPIPEEYYEKINTDLTKKFIIPGLNNVLASLLFPLACTLSKQIYLWGFDGRAPGDKLFWKNSEKHTYPHLIPELQKAHPAFFEHYVPQKDTNRYIKLAFGELLDQLLIKAESEGFTFTMMHKSWTTTLQKRFRNDNVLTNDYQSFFAERKLCPNPFISLEINRIGKVSVCCPERMNDGYKYFGNIINHSLNEIWNSKQLQNLRQIMYDGQYDISCKPFCPQLLALQKGKIPPWYSHLCEKDTHTEILKNKTILSSTYKSISVASDGSCNLNCIMCRHEKKVQPDEFEKKINLILYDQILLNISEIRFLELTGNGDPFYSSEVNILLKRLRTVDTQHLTIRFITNAQLLNKKKWQQIEQLNLKELRISVSIDAASQSTYESIRRGAKWSTLMEHMNMLAQKRREGKLNMLQVNFCVMKRNIHEMIHFIHLAKSWNCDSIEFQRIMGTLAGDENIFDNKNSIYLQKLASVIKDPVFEEKWIEASSLLEYRNYIPEKNTSMNNLDSDKQSNIKKIAIFMFNYPLGVSEIIIETALNLANKGFFVDIFIDHKFLAMSPISFNNEKIRVFPVQSIDIPHLNLSETLSSFPPNYFKYIQFNKRFPHFSLYIKNILMMVNDTKYDILIGVEPLGLVSSYIISCLYNIPLIYYNMELYQLSNCRTGEAFLLKKLEIDASQKCVFSVLPDKYRTAVFIKENNVPEEKIRYLPISTGGEPIYEKGNYFREKFNIPAWKKILIYAGNIASWAMCEELVEAGSSLPEEYVMVLHFWRETTARDSFLNKLKQKASSNIYFSLQPLPRDLFIKAISSADAGLMFYRPIDENFTEIGSSSNKLSIYLKAGLPVIASDFKSVKEIFDRYKCGECATSPYEMKLAIDLIFKNYTKYKEGALKAFSDHYNFDKNFSLLLHEITNII